MPYTYVTKCLHCHITTKYLSIEIFFVENFSTRWRHQFTEETDSGSIPQTARAPSSRRWLGKSHLVLLLPRQSWNLREVCWTTIMPTTEMFCWPKTMQTYWRRKFTIRFYWQMQKPRTSASSRTTWKNCHRKQNWNSCCKSVVRKNYKSK